MIDAETTATIYIDKDIKHSESHKARGSNL